MRYLGAIVVFLSALGVSSGSRAACERYDGTVGDPQALSISADSFNVRSDDPKASQLLTTLGTLKNSGNSCFANVIVEVKYFDAKRTLIDSVTQALEDVVVPGGQEVAYRTMAQPARRKEEYASQSVRVLSAREIHPNSNYGGSAQSNNKTIQARIGEFFYVFGPVILLIGIWWYFVRFQLRNKKSPQVRSIALMERQTELLEKKNELLGRIAVALEGRI